MPNHDAYYGMFKRGPSPPTSYIVVEIVLFDTGDRCGVYTSIPEEIES